MTTTFTTTVLQAPGMKATGLPVPDDAIAQLGTTKNPAVIVKIGEYTYRNTVSSRYGGFIISLSSEHRSALGLTAGDTVEVTLELDTAPRTVEIPDDLGAALDAAPGTRAAFDALSPSRRGAFVTQVTGAKAAETRARRITTIVEQLAV